MDIKEAMKIVAEQVIVKGDERIEEALQTVELELGLKPIVSHGNGEPFHYVREWHGPGPYNKLYQFAREKIYDKLKTDDAFDEWLQKHTVIDHFEGAILIRQPTAEVHSGAIEFHDIIRFINDDGNMGYTLYRHFEDLLQRPLSEREGHAETA